MASIIFDTGSSPSPYPSLPGVFKGKLTIKGSGYVKITDIRTRACPGTGGHVSSWSIHAGKGDEIKKGTYEYDIEVHLASYPQFFHGVDKIENAEGIVKAVSFVDANGRTHTDWIPSLVIIGEALPELTCDKPTPSFASGCELLLHYDTDKDGKIEYHELSGGAIKDWNEKKISTREVYFVAEAWAKDSINAVCPGCYTTHIPAGDITKVELDSKLLPEGGTLDWIAGKQAAIRVYFKNVGNAPGKFHIWVTDEDGATLCEVTTSTEIPADGVERYVTCGTFTPTEVEKKTLTAHIEP